MALTVSLLTIRPAGTVTAPVQAMMDDYLRRCERAFAADCQVYRTEEALLSAAVGKRKQGAANLWIADLGGRTLTTDEFAERVRQVRDGGLRHLMLAIGPANGWSSAARAAAELRLSLGAMTLPHELAALVLAEQIYRVSTILQGHPYHLGH
ncbi:MAG: 23S rRNA (pseudouridine(1915)-N(3))-methyltransferase RlmH [Janthinobacterium lividum]